MRYEIRDSPLKQFSLARQLVEIDDGKVRVVVDWLGDVVTPRTQIYTARDCTRITQAQADALVMWALHSTHPRGLGEGGSERWRNKVREVLDGLRPDDRR